MPADWTDEYSNLSTSTDKVTSSAHYSGSNSFGISGTAGVAKGIKQTVNVSGSENDTYILSGWAKANAVPDDGSDTRKFKLSVKVTYTDGTTAWQSPAAFNYSIPDWQFTSVAFTLSDGNSNTNKTPSTITVCARYQNQSNTVYFDNLCLEKDNAQSYTYDKDGNLISVVDNSQEKSQMEYTNSDLTKSTDAKGYDYTYEYDDNHNMLKATSQTGTSYNYEYTKGLATSLEVKGNDVGTIRTEAHYDNSGMLETLTDANGNNATYQYNGKTGTLTSITDDSGTTTYDYDSNTNQCTGVSKTDGKGGTYSIGYNYSSDSKYLESIEHSDTIYNLEYDQYGNKTDSMVGTQSLATYTYNSNNGALVKTTYGTGQTVGYSYDAFGNVSTQKYNGTTAFTWSSDRSGNIIREKDLVNSIQYDLTYDTTGRLVRKTAKKMTGVYNTNNSLYTLEYGYDLNNNITRLANNTLSRSSVSKYEYGKDNLPSKFIINELRSVSYGYDGLNRLTSTSLNTTTPVNTSYEYYDSARDGDYTTNMLMTETINGVTYKYEYDTRGNITEISKEISQDQYELICKYEYDAINQLTYSWDKENRLACTYYYDNNGNLVSEVVCKLDSNDVVIGTKRNNYTYGDSNWTDKLTEYNGQEITYDEIGNPLSYRDGIVMTWKNGRQLDTFANGANSVSYSYDNNSVRVSKTVNGVECTYEYLNGMLLYETRGEAKFYYSYDANGTLYSVKYTLTDSSTLLTYYYTHNSRGDIVGIYNGDGVLRVKYDYDAWGNVISITDGNGNAITSETHIGNLNPFRYRGYYYDTESGFYYLMSRYYDPVTHRFINADGYFQSGGDILDANMCVYCRNNPISFVDPLGNHAKNMTCGAPTCSQCRPERPTIKSQ